MEWDFSLANYGPVWSFMVQLGLLLLFMLGRRVGLKERMVIAQALSVNDLDAVVRLQKTVLIGSFAIEAVGAVVLMFRFLPEVGFLQALKWGVFHSVSAFCNAGFDNLGGDSLKPFVLNPLLNLLFMALIISGGIGFAVWVDIKSLRGTSHVS